MLTALVFIGSIGAIGCDEPTSVEENVWDRIELELGVDPGVVALGDTFTVRLQVRNPGAQPDSIWMGCTALVVPRVYQEGEIVPFRGAMSGCRHSVGWYRLEPGATKAEEFQVVAETLQGEVATPGNYSVRAEIHSVDPPALETWLVVEE